MYRIAGFDALSHSKFLVAYFIVCIISCMVKPIYSSTDEHSDKEIDRNSYVKKVPDGRLSYIFSKTTIKENASQDEDYPSDLINANMNKSGKTYTKLFGSDYIPRDPDGQLKDRFDDMNQQYFCQSEVRVAYPKYGVTAQNTAVAIVNTDKFMQGVRVDICRHVGKSCNIRKYRSRTQCVQSYYYRTLVTFNADTKAFSKEAVQLPSGCKCAVY